MDGRLFSARDCYVVEVAVTDQLMRPSRISVTVVIICLLCKLSLVINTAFLFYSVLFYV